MKHIFIINPAAGNSDPRNRILTQLGAIRGLDYDIYITNGPHDATNFVSRWCENNRRPVRFYACGGDGTLNEVVNGAVGHAQASVGCYPCGSGNDYVKYYGAMDSFMEIKRLVEGVELPVDLLRANGVYAINACHFGFDTAVAKTIGRIKYKPVIGGKNAYPTAVLLALLTSMKNSYTVYADGEPLNDKNLLLCTVANGAYVGGSYKCAPYSCNNDGLLEVCLFKPVSRLKFVSLISVYKNGEHLEDKRIGNTMIYRRAKRVDVVAESGSGYSLDGEVFAAKHFSIDVVERAMRFIVPKTLAPDISETVINTDGVG